MKAMADAVKVTLGPRGRTVVLEQTHMPPRSTKDGAAVADHIELDDHIENAGAQILRLAAPALAVKRSGTAPATAVVITQALAQERIKAVTAGHNPMEVRRGLMGRPELGKRQQAGETQ